MFSAKLLAREEYRWISDSILDVPAVLDPPHFLRLKKILQTSCSAHHLHEAYSESCRTSKTELSAKIVNDWESP